MKNLATFVAQQNFHASLFGRPPMDAARLTPAEREQLLGALESALSPENLCCDGELRGRALQQKARMLNGALRELQKLARK